MFSSAVAEEGQKWVKLSLHPLTWLAFFAVLPAGSSGRVIIHLLQWKPFFFSPCSLQSDSKRSIALCNKAHSCNKFFLLSDRGVAGGKEGGGKCARASEWNSRPLRRVYSEAKKFRQGERIFCAPQQGELTLTLETTSVQRRNFICARLCLVTAQNYMIFMILHFLLFSWLNIWRRKYERISSGAAETTLWRAIQWYWKAFTSRLLLFSSE